MLLAKRVTGKAEATTCLSGWGLQLIPKKPIETLVGENLRAAVRGADGAAGQARDGRGGGAQIFARIRQPPSELQTLKS